MEDSRVESHGLNAMIIIEQSMYREEVNDPDSLYNYYKAFDSVLP